MKSSQESWSDNSREDDCKRKVGLITMATLINVSAWRSSSMILAWCFSAWRSSDIFWLGAALVYFRLGAALVFFGLAQL